MNYDAADPWLDETMNILGGLDSHVFALVNCVELPEELEALADAADDDPEFDADFDEWYEWLSEQDMLLAVEQSCNSEGLLLPWDMRAVRLQTLPPPLMSLLHFFFKKCPANVRALLVQQVFWLVRFERVHRCGTPVWKADEVVIPEHEREPRGFFRPNKITYRNYGR